MKKGGYQIIDFKDFPVKEGSESFIIPGIYDLIEGTRKPILLSGINAWNREYPDVFMHYRLSGTSFVFTMSNIGFGEIGTITVSDTDVVTFTAK